MLSSQRSVRISCNNGQAVWRHQRPSIPRTSCSSPRPENTLSPCIVRPLHDLDPGIQTPVQSRRRETELWPIRNHMPRRRIEFARTPRLESPYLPQRPTRALYREDVGRMYLSWLLRREKYAREVSTREVRGVHSGGPRSCFGPSFSSLAACFSFSSSSLLLLPFPQCVHSPPFKSVSSLDCLVLYISLALLF